MQAQSNDYTPIHQLKITLKHIQPRIWRRVLAPGDVSLVSGPIHLATAPHP
ncbi:MAG: plasmid pRiA4b ORF-3 family protein [Chloroflexi bacterium]|nr:plasmid pRiA4b ORF-3 family protein [Chloroflexota bacterium]